MNWIKASKLVFEQYLGEGFITTQRQLSDGDYIIHFELSNSMFVLCHLDNRVTLYTNEALMAYLQFVEGDGNET